MISLPLVVLILIAILYGQYATYPGVAGALRGMGAVAAGMIAAASLRLLPALKRHPIGVPLCTVIGVAAFIGVGLLRLPLVPVLLGLGVVACGLTYFRMTR